MDISHGVVSAWMHGLDPADTLEINSKLERFHADMKQNPRLLEAVIDTNLLRNQHRLLFSMIPDENYNKSLLDEEAERLKTKLQQLSPSDKERIYKEGLELLQAQDSIQGLLHITLKCK